MKTPVVLDASAALDFAFDEGDAPMVDLLMREAIDAGPIAPQHWRLEVANGMATRLRRGVLARSEARELMARLDKLDVELDEETAALAWGPTFSLAERHGLTSYDAAYLELALRRGARLGTFDGPLADAAVAEGVELVVPRKRKP